MAGVAADGIPRGARASGVVAAAIVAALFAVHPMNVAAVAPVSVRSSLLYSTCYLAAFAAYLRYLDAKLGRWLWVSLGLFVLSALSKSAAVTLPLLMLATDWYVGRLSERAGTSADGREALRDHQLSRGRLAFAIVREKWAFFVVAVVFGVVTFVFREDTAGMQSIPPFAAWERVFLASYTFLFYLAGLVVPVNLSAHYPYPIRVDGHLPIPFFLAPVAVAAVAWAVWRAATWATCDRLRRHGLPPPHHPRAEGRTAWR